MPVDSSVIVRAAKEYRGEIDAVYVYRDYLLIFGWLDTPLKRTAGAYVEVDDQIIDIREDSFQYFREDVHAAIGGISQKKTAFVSLLRTGVETEASSAVFQVGQLSRRRPIVRLDDAADLLDRLLANLALAVAHWKDPTVLYSVPSNIIVGLQSLYRAMLDEQSLPMRSCRSVSQAEGPACSLVFVQHGPMPLLPLITQVLRDVRHSLELVVVNNSPAFRQETLMTLAEASEIHGIAWGYIEPEVNIGFGPACNVAARNARGGALLFHNNDVFTPRSADYDRVIDAIQAKPSRIVGARQYFPSGGVMHDGIQVGILDPVLTGGENGILSGMSIGRGPMPGVAAGPTFTSGSFLGLKRDLFMSAGSFSEDYLFGHFEDLDLGLRLHREGVETHIVRETELVHCEGRGSAVPDHILSTVPTLNRIVFNSAWKDYTQEWFRPA